jgi:hypothetical protein
MIISIIALLAVGGIRWGSPIFAQASYLYWQHRCLTAREPETLVVYESDPSLAANLVASNGRYHFPMRPLFERGGPPASSRPPAYYRPAAYDRVAIPHGAGVDGVAFLHAMCPPGETARLVVCSFGCAATETDGRYICAISMTTWLPASYKLGSAVRGERTNLPMLCIYVFRGERLRIFAGQLDPADSAHFTIPYDIEGVRGTIDGRIAASGTAQLSLRDGLASKRTYDSYDAQAPRPPQSLVEPEKHLAFLQQLLDHPGNRSASYLRNVRADMRRTRALIDDLRIKKRDNKKGDKEPEKGP